MAKKTLSTRVEDSIARRIEVVAEIERTNVAEIVARCLKEELPRLEYEAAEVEKLRQKIKGDVFQRLLSTGAPQEPSSKPKKKVAA